MSLRDVERTMKVMAWFYEHLEDLGPLMDKKVSEMNPKDESDDDDDGDDDDDNEDEELNTVKVRCFFYHCNMFTFLNVYNENYKNEISNSLLVYLKD